MKASEFKTKQAIKNQIYRTIQSLTSKIYRDEDWSNVFHLVDRIKEEGVEVSCYPNGCGGYRSNNEGQPMYAVENTMYFISQEKKETTMKCARITESEYDALQFACKTKDKVYFKFQLFQLGIVKRWKAEADEFIQFLEDKTGMKWVDPYNGEGRVDVKPLTEDELKHIEEGEWTEKAILKAEKKRKELMKKAALLKLKEDHELKIWHENKEYEVKKYLLEKGYEDCNMIYYPHKKVVEFNWVSWKPSFTIDDYNALMSDNRKPKDVDYVWKEPQSK